MSCCLSEAMYCRFCWTHKPIELNLLKIKLVVFFASNHHVLNADLTIAGFV